jgi:hypothetical protein
MAVTVSACPLGDGWQRGYGHHRDAGRWSISITRVDGKLCVAPEWDPQMGKFGYARKLRYVFFDKGGHVAMCKRYRAYAKEAGLLKTLEVKRRENPSVDLLIGAVNVWYWEKDALAMLQEMQSKGIDRFCE